MPKSNNLVRWTKGFVVFAIMAQSSTAFGWGQIGHRVSGKIAESYLSEDASKQIKKLFPNESLAEISTYADEERANPSKFWQKTAGPWHYVTVPSGSDYKHPQHAPTAGDAYTALAAFKKTLNSKTASLEEKQLALHFTVHIIGDLHQPLHTGNGTDKGGNTVKVEFFWDDSNLHRVWDSGLIDRQNLSYTEWASWLQQKMSPQTVALWQQTDPRVWIKESIELRNGLYPDDLKLSWQYQYDHIPAVKTRLQMAGVRIAAYLNEVFE